MDLIDMAVQDFWAEEAKIVNWKGKATRVISSDQKPVYKVGQKINPGLHWSENGKFSDYDKDLEYISIFKIIEDVKGRKIDYKNDFDGKMGLFCCEKEVLINSTFNIFKIEELTDTITLVLLKKGGS